MVTQAVQAVQATQALEAGQEALALLARLRLQALLLVAPVVALTLARVEVARGHLA